MVEGLAKEVEELGSSLFHSEGTNYQDEAGLEVRAVGEIGVGWSIDQLLTRKRPAFISRGTARKVAHRIIALDSSFCRKSAGNKPEGHLSAGRPSPGGFNHQSNHFSLTCPVDLPMHNFMGDYNAIA